MATAIQADHVSKEYRLGTINHGTLYKDVQGWIARKIGKPDPNAPIEAGSHEDRGDRFWALKDLSFKVEQGERIGIIGKNGAGKSTLLKILSRITAPTEGIVVTEGKIASLLEVGTGFHGELTGRENVYLNGAIMGMKKRTIDRKLDEIVDFAGIGQFVDTPVKRYSSGMYVRLGFSVAAHLDAETLIVDEVLAVGDADFQRKCLAKMEKISMSEGKTILFVSHNVVSVARICTKTMLLDRGSITHFAETSEVIREYLYKGDQHLNSFSTELKQQKLTITKANVTKKNETASETDLLTRHDFLEIGVECYLQRELVGLSVAAEISTNAGDILFVTSTYDETCDLSKEYETGRHTFSFSISLAAFREGMYNVKVTAVIPRIEWLDEIDRLLSFEVTDLDSPVKVTGEGRQGLIMPIIPWKHQYQGNQG
jgi:lipopolysaccharide transport system ATP-binding protein